MNTQQIKNIMVCLDLTEMDDLLISYTSYLAELFEDLGKILFVHNIRQDFPEEITATFDELEKPVSQYVVEEIMDKIDGAFDDPAGEFETQVFVEEEASTIQILTQLAKENKIDLAIVGKKISYTGSGTIASKLLRTLNCSMLFLPETARHRISNILVPVDFSKASRQTLVRAIRLKEKSRSALSCIHIYSIPQTYFPFIPVETTSESLQKHAQESFKKFRKNLNGENLNGIDFVALPNKDKSVAHNIYTYALRRQSDLIVVGSKGRNSMTTLVVGSVTIGLSNMDMYIPLLIVK